MTDKVRKEPLIEVRKIKKFFPLKKKHIFQKGRLNVRAVEDVSLKIFKGETLGLVGESGCGKSTLGRVLLQLYPPTSGSALYYGIPLRQINPKYVLKDIKSLPKLQDKARKSYQKAEKYDQKAEELNAFIISEEHKLIKEELKNKVSEVEAQIKEQEELRQTHINDTIAVLKSDAEAYREANPNVETVGKGIRWEDEVNRVLNLLENFDNSIAIENYISLLPIPRKNTATSYNKVMKVSKVISKLNTKLKGLSETKYEKQYAKLKFNSKEAKKQASRLLKIGSETAGEYILEADIKEISELFLREELLHREKFNKEKTIKSLSKKVELNNKRLVKFENELNSTTGDERVSELNKEIDEVKLLIKNQEEKIALLNTEVKDLQSEQELVLAELKTYHFKNPQPITERCLNPEYQKKMESNRELAINLEKVGKEEMRVLRQKLQIIFQDPYSSLDPRMTVGQAISEAVVEHKLFKKKSPELEEYIIETMAKCGLDHYMIHRYPHQFSGGQRQRIVIARALALQPEFVVCDESVSALDVSIQSQILNLLQDLKEMDDLTYLFISHDLSVIKHISDRIGVMYLGNMVELSESEALYENPLHPYSKALISAIPTTTENKRKRIILEGDIPSNIFPPSGCKFRTRCPLAREKCAEVVPEFREVEPGRFVACHFYEETKTL